jgi:hypothetical protein
MEVLRGYIGVEPTGHIWTEASSPGSELHTAFSLRPRGRGITAGNHGTAAMSYDAFSLGLGRNRRSLVIAQTSAFGR